MSSILADLALTIFDGPLPHLTTLPEPKSTEGYVIMPMREGMRCEANEREPGHRQPEFFEETSHLQQNHKLRDFGWAPPPLVVPVDGSQFKARPPLPGRWADGTAGSSQWDSSTWRGRWRISVPTAATGRKTPGFRHWRKC